MSNATTCCVEGAGQVVRGAASAASCGTSCVCVDVQLGRVRGELAAAARFRQIANWHSRLPAALAAWDASETRGSQAYAPHLPIPLQAGAKPRQHLLARVILEISC